ncbi:NADAR family protein [uncultured Clostridium sp.]|uniref:NADAR family protein n=1 Tax=uncultured Clostridium sp. TaxID=59620 RepID=UPI002614DE0D|nr:NADAR family protein [uncultured Clostridium sp.]
MRVINKKVFFYGSSEIFSNWHRCNFRIDNIKFNCSEQAMMYYKAKMFRDYEIADRILRSRNPKDQKQLGREVRNFDENYWNNNREEVMYRILLEKFSQNQDFKKELLKYKDYDFVEASPYDRIWGIGLREDNDLVLDESNWRGLNLLGKCLTRVCNELSK